MIMKLLLLAALLAAVYFLFFKKKSVPNSGGTGNSDGSGKGEETVPCAKCGAYVSLDDAIVSNGKYYCSPECLNG